MVNQLVTRYARHILIVTALIAPAMGYGAAQVFSSTGNDIRQWLPASFQETRVYDWFVQQFGSEEMIVASWPGATSDGADVKAVVEGLRNVTSADGEAPLFSRVITASEILEQLTNGMADLSMPAARRRLQGALIGPDGQTTAIVAMLSPAGAADRHAAVRAVYDVASDLGGVSQIDLRLGGPTIESVALDTESQRSRIKLAGIAVFVASCLAWWCLRDFRLVVAVFAAGIFAAVSALATVYYSGGSPSILMISMPTLIYVLTVSAGIHLVNYFIEGQPWNSLEQAIQHAVETSVTPCTLTVVTTALGLGSLAISQVLPVRNFGIYSSLGVMISLPVVLLILPAAIYAFRICPQRSLVRESKGRSGQRIEHLLRRSHRYLVGGFVAVMLLSSTGLVRLDSSVHLLNLFDRHSRILADYSWLEAKMGPLVPIEIVLTIPHDHPSSLVDRLQLISKVERRIQQFPDVGSTMSAATWTPDIPDGGGLRQVTRRKIVLKELTKNRDSLVRTRYLSDTPAGELWRISARVAATTRPDYGQLTGDIETAISQVVTTQLAGNDDSSGRSIKAQVTGVVPLVYKAQRVLLRDLSVSFVTAFGLIALAIIIMLRSIRAGLLAMLPNVFPAGLAFGAMGWLDVSCDIGSMMTASVAMGIAVDDTVHFLHGFRHRIQGGRSRTQAILETIRTNGRSMIHTTLICGFGMLVFGFSEFVPTSRFAILMFVLLATALIADTVLLPAMLMGRWGKFFEPALPVPNAV